MLNNVLPDIISKTLDRIPYLSLCELRLRSDSPVVVNVQGENFFLSDNILSKDENSAFIISKDVLQGIMQRLTKHSLYSVNDQIINGYISYDGGIRVGICGEVVSNDDKVKTIKNISSINFRFPHLIKNCSLDVVPYIFDSNGEILNTLIVSSPGAGKTTYLRDIVHQLSKKNNLLNILIVDERQELATVFNGENIAQLSNVDVYSNCSKKFAFNNGIRSMKPDVIITDEINIDKDIEDIENAMTSGVKIFASIHAGSIHELKNKSKFNDLLYKGLFERFVVLSKNGGVGRLEGVYNQNLNLIGV